MARTRARAGGSPLQVVTDYFSGTRAELRRVSWPDREEASRLTAIVLVVTLAMSAVLGLMDFVFARLIGLII